MDATVYPFTLEEFKLFQGIDRELFTILVRDLGRNPSECLMIMGLWLWMERSGFSNVIGGILSKTSRIVNELADEAVACLHCIDSVRFPFKVVAADGIPLTRSLVNKDISLQFFHDSRLTAYHEILDLVTAVYIPALSDIIESVCNGGFSPGSTKSQTTVANHGVSISSAKRNRAALSSSDETLMQCFSNLSLGADNPTSSQSRAASKISEIPLHGRTLFATFSKGYPVSENEVRHFFTSAFGSCIESVHMQQVGPTEQALYARIVLHHPSFLETILGGLNKAKFTINGKHVWIRRFIPNNGRLLPCGCSTSDTSTCPH